MSGTGPAGTGPEPDVRPDGSGPVPVLLRAAGVAVLLDVGGPLLPRVLHWGADPGPLDAQARRRLAADLQPGVAVSAPDAGRVVTLLPGQADGWSGTPGLSGHRDGADPFPRLVLAEPVRQGEGRLDVRAVDEHAGLAVDSEFRLEPSGLLRVRHRVTNTGAGTYTVDGLLATMPVPDQARELLDLTGRWCRERSPQRRPFGDGTHARASRRGRTGHDATLLLLCGTPGFGFRSGEVWGMHVAWSGNHLHQAERLPDGAGAGGSGLLAGGELLAPGEVRLAPGESYTGPWTCFTYGARGLDEASGRVHRWLRARPQHPARPRPLVLNTWEAVYFDHDADRLAALARRAARIGVERFVLDDGWFRHRRDDTAGLGDWYVDEAVWPQGLGPLADLVHGLGMEFGLWVEPEMVNPDSDLARAHPDWLLGPSPRPAGSEAGSEAGSDAGSEAGGLDAGRMPPAWRHQQVLDVARPEAFDHLLGRLDALVGELGVDYLKWDHNRDLHEPLHAGIAGVRLQTLAAYRLMDRLRERHPGLEIESCASGGARIDLEILQRTDRVWASDTNDPIERQAIQRWTGLLLPPELVGGHVGPAVAHTTGRATGLELRLLTALFGHAGLEWDISTCTDAELAELTRWSALYRELRPLLHSGDVVRADHPDPGSWLHGVVSADRRSAVYCYVRLATSAQVDPGRLRLPGLDAATRYQVRRRGDGGPRGAVLADPPWWRHGSALTSGSVLDGVGLPAPFLGPGQACLIEVAAGWDDPPGR